MNVGDWFNVFEGFHDLRCWQAASLCRTLGLRATSRYVAGLSERGLTNVTNVKMHKLIFRI